MTKISSKIKRQAKAERKKTSPRKKLTDLQNKLARNAGYNSFKHLLTQEKAIEKDNLRKNAFKGKESKDGISIDFINKHVAVYVGKNGHRGLKALKDFDAGETVFAEQYFLCTDLSEVIDDEGLPWTLTRNIIFKFPDAITDMLDNGNFYPHFTPKLDSEDKGILSRISQESGKSTVEVKLIYNLVCTYSYRITFQIFVDGQVLSGERIAISFGLAYANHSCTPNAERINTGLDKLQNNYDGLVATQKIKKGDEITWSYIGDSIPSDLKDRRNQIKDQLGFICECLTCKVIKNKESM